MKTLLERIITHFKIIKNMKKFILSIVALFFTLTLLAQKTVNNTVYFGNVSKKTSVGLGIYGNDVTLSLMEIVKSKNYDDFELRLYDMNGQPIEIEMKEDTIYHLELDKTYAHQKDFKMNMRDYVKLKMALDSQSYVIINGLRYNGAAFTGILKSLETEQNLFLTGLLPNIRNVSIWTWQRGVEMMRFKHPQSKNFRYIRRGATDR